MDGWWRSDLGRRLAKGGSCECEGVEAEVVASSNPRGRPHSIEDNGSRGVPADAVTYMSNELGRVLYLCTPGGRSMGHVSLS